MNDKASTMTKWVRVCAFVCVCVCMRETEKESENESTQPESATISNNKKQKMEIDRVNFRIESNIRIGSRIRIPNHIQFNKFSKRTHQELCTAVSLFNISTLCGVVHGRKSAYTFRLM